MIFVSIDGISIEVYIPLNGRDEPEKKIFYKGRGGADSKYFDKKYYFVNCFLDILNIYLS